MKIIDQTLRQIDNSSQRVVGAATDFMNHAESFLVLAYVGVVANTWERLNGSRDNA